MADFTYTIPNELMNKFPGFMPGGQNRIYVGGDYIRSDDEARQEVADITWIPIQTVWGLGGGEQNFAMGVPVGMAIRQLEPGVIEFRRTMGLTGDISEAVRGYNPTTGFPDPPPSTTLNQSGVVYGSQAPTDVLDVVPTAMSAASTASIDQSIDYLGLDTSYKKTAKENIKAQNKTKWDDFLEKQKKDLEKRGIDLDKSRLLNEKRYKNLIDSWKVGGDSEEETADFWAVMGDSLTQTGEAVKVQDLINNPQQFLDVLEGDEAKLVYIDEATGVPILNPWVAQAIDLAGEQAGHISKEQIALIQNQAAFEIAKMNKDSQLALAKEEGLSNKEVAEIRANADVEIAGISESNRRQEFNYLDRKATLEFDLQNRAQQNEYNLLMMQGEKSDKASDRQHAQTMKQFDLQRQQFEGQQQQQLFQHTETMGELAARREQEAILAALEREARAAEVNLRSEDINRQMERDRITAETNQKIEEIRRLSAGDVAGIDKQIAQRRSEEAEELARLEQQTILGTGAQQLQATLAGTEADIQIATTQAQAQKEAQLAIQALQDSAAVDELTKAKEIATLYANAEKESQLAIEQLRKTTILGDLEKAKAIATLQQAMQITAQEAAAALQVNQGISDVEKAKAVATIQENTRATTDLAIAELQANTKITELEKTNILGTMQAGATTQAATTQAGAVTGAAALQAEAASPFGYVGAGEDAADRAQRLTDAQSILGQQYNPYGLSNEQFTGMQNVAAQAGATPFGALSTAPDARYQDILGVQQAQAAAGPFQAAQLGQGMGDISTILRGGNTPEQQLALAQAPGNPFGLTANEQMALQNSLARGGLTPTQRLAEVQAGSAPQNMANYLNFIGNPAAVGFAGQSGFLQNMADSPEGNLPASLFGLNVPQAAPTVPTNPTMADLTNLTDEQLGFYQGQQAAQNYQTPSQIFQQAQMVTPQGV